MRISHWLRCIAFLALAGAPLLAPAQQPAEGETARGAFIKSRPNSRGPKSTLPATPSPPIASPPSTGPNAPNIGARIVTSGPIGLGYTFFKQVTGGRAVRVEPSHVFRTGDEVSVVIEPSINGYLYVFATEITKDGEGEPAMLFPNPRLNGGENRITAHVPYEVPSSFEPDPDNRWFEFNDPPSTNRLWLVVSRRPLSDEVPSGEKLLALCRAQANPAGCQWGPQGAFWKQVVAGAGAERRTSVRQGPALALSNVEREAATRGIGLKPKDPQPWTVEVSVSPTADTFVVKVDLIQH